MSNRVRLVVVAALGLLVVSLGLVVASAPVAAAGSYTHFFKGNVARAVYSSSEESTCTSTSVTVTASESMTRDASLSQGWAPSISVVLSQTTGCTEAKKIWAVGFWPLNAEDFYFVGNTARVKTQGQLNEYYSDSQMPVDIDLTWTGVGERHAEVESGVEHDLDYTYTWRSVGITVDAVVSGTVFDGTTNWTPVSGNWVKNSLKTTTQGFVDVSH